MYIALAIMFLGIILGRLFMKRISPPLIHSLINISIWSLLFFLGGELGKNEALLMQLPNLGLTSLLLCLFFLAGSILAQWLLKKSGLVKFGNRKK